MGGAAFSDSCDSAPSACCLLKLFIIHFLEFVCHDFSPFLFETIFLKLINVSFYFPLLPPRFRGSVFLFTLPVYQAFCHKTVIRFSASLPPRFRGSLFCLCCQYIRLSVTKLSYAFLRPCRRVSAALCFVYIVKYTRRTVTKASQTENFFLRFLPPYHLTLPSPGRQYLFPGFWYHTRPG